MKNDILDCQGLACPGPVLACKRLVDESRPNEISCLVDNEAAKENVSRYLTTQGYEVQVEETGTGSWKITGLSQGDAPAPAPTPQPARATEDNGTLVFISSEAMGLGDDVLGKKLMINFLATLPELGERLWRIILVNGAVKLASTEGPALESLKALHKSGVSILVCGTCLDHFNLLAQKQIGETTNMLDVVTSLDLATKVIQV